MRIYVGNLFHDYQKILTGFVVKNHVNGLIVLLRPPPLFKEEGVETMRSFVAISQVVKCLHA